MEGIRLYELDLFGEDGDKKELVSGLGKIETTYDHEGSRSDKSKEINPEEWTFMGED